MNFKTQFDRGLRFILRKTFSSLFYRLLGLLSGLLFSWLVATRYGAYGLGLLSINLAVIYLSIVLLKLGIDTHVVSEVAQLKIRNRQDEIRAYYRKTMLIFIVTSCFGTTLLYVLSEPLGRLINVEGGANYIKTTGMCLIPLMLLHLNAAFMRAFKKIAAFSFFLNGGASFVSLPLIIPFLDDTERAYLPLYVQLAAIVALALISLLMTIRLIRPLGRTQKCKSYGQIIRESIPMMVTLAVHPIWNWGAMFVLGIYAPVAVVGVFQILLRCSNLIGLPVRAVSTIMAPIISEESYNKGNGTIPAVIKRTSMLSMSLSFPVVLIIVSFPGLIMGIFGEEFVGYGHLLVVLALAKFINACYGPLGIVLLMTGNQVLQSKLSVAELIFYLVAAMFFNWVWGLNGAVLAMSVSILFRNLLTGYQIKRIFGVYPLALLHIGTFVKSRLNHNV